MSVRVYYSWLQIPELQKCDIFYSYLTLVANLRISDGREVIRT